MSTQQMSTTTVIDIDAVGIQTLDDFRQYHEYLLKTFGYGLSTCHTDVTYRMKHTSYHKAGRKISPWSLEFREDHKLGWEYGNDNKCTVCHGVRQSVVKKEPYFILLSSRTCACGARLIVRLHWSNTAGKIDLMGISYYCQACDIDSKI
jgi:hypothetical protein